MRLDWSDLGTPRADATHGIARTADIVGPSHVGLGTDMMGLAGPSTFDSYALLP